MSGSLPSLQGVRCPSPAFPPPPSPPPAFLAPSGERCWESDTTGPIQLSLLRGEQTPAQELGSCWTELGGGGNSLPLFLCRLLRIRYPSPRGCDPLPPGAWEGGGGMVTCTWQCPDVACRLSWGVTLVALAGGHTGRDESGGTRQGWLQWWQEMGAMLHGGRWAKGWAPRWPPTGLSLADPTAAAPQSLEVCGGGGVLAEAAVPPFPLLLPQPWPLFGTSTPGAPSCLAKTNPSFLQLNSGELFKKLL